MRDKDLAQVIKPLLPLVTQWHVCSLPTPRAASAQELRAVLHRAGVERPSNQVAAGGGAGAGTPGDMGAGAALDGAIHTHADPAEALRAALSAADPADRILVFGSFWTVGGVIAQGLPKLGSAHGR